VRADAHAVAQRDLAFEDAADVDLDILPQLQRAAQVEARRVGQAHAGLHQRVGLAALEAALQVGQLQRAVDAQHLGLVGGHRLATTGTPSATAMATMSVR
jgi:protein-disulfide isomerase-like protein with CxxC motif